MRTINRVQILILGVISTISRVLPAPANFPIRQPPPGQNVFVPPDIKYWAYGKINTTVIDNLGLPWYCYTNRQTHCMPLFQKPPNFQTTRRPYGVASNQNGILQPSDIQPEQQDDSMSPKYRSEESQENQIGQPPAIDTDVEQSYNLTIKSNDINNSTEREDNPNEDRIDDTTLIFPDGFNEQADVSDLADEITIGTSENSNQSQEDDSLSDIKTDSPTNPTLVEDGKPTESPDITPSNQGTISPSNEKVSQITPTNAEDQIQFPFDDNAIDEKQDLNDSSKNSAPEATFKIVDLNGTTALQVDANNEEGDANLEVEVTTRNSLEKIIFGTASSNLQFPEDSGINTIGEQSRSRSIKHGPIVNHNFPNTSDSESSSHPNDVNPSGVFFPIETPRLANEDENKSGKQPRMIDGFLIHAASNTINESGESTSFDGIPNVNNSTGRQTTENVTENGTPSNFMLDQSASDITTLDLEPNGTTTTKTTTTKTTTRTTITTQSFIRVVESDELTNQFPTINSFQDEEETQTAVPTANFEAVSSDLDEQKVMTGTETMPNTEYPVEWLGMTTRPNDNVDNLTFDYERTDDTQEDNSNENSNAGTELPDQISSTFDVKMPSTTTVPLLWVPEQNLEETTKQTTASETTKLYLEPSSTESSPLEEHNTNTTDAITSSQEKIETSFDVLGNNTDDLLNRVLNILNQNQTQTTITSPKESEDIETTTANPFQDENSLMQRNRNPKQSTDPNCKSCNIAIQFSRPKEEEENEINQGVVILPGDQGYHWKYEVDDEFAVTTPFFDIRILGESEPDDNGQTTATTVQTTATTVQPMVSLPDQTQGTSTKVDEPIDALSTTTPTAPRTSSEPFSFSIAEQTEFPFDTTTPSQETKNEIEDPDQQISTFVTTTIIPVEITVTEEMQTETTTDSEDALISSTGASINVNASISVEDTTVTATSTEKNTTMPSKSTEDTTLAIEPLEPIGDTDTPSVPTTTIPFTSSEPTINSTAQPRLNPDDLLNALLLDVGDVISNQITNGTSPLSPLIPEDTPVLAPAYTVYGEKCNGTCEDRGYPYTWCYKLQPSNIGTWRDSDYCSNHPRITPYGESCIDGCEKRGYEYYWCHKSTLWGHCVPDHLLEMANTWKTLFGEQPLYAKEFMDAQPAPSYTIYGKLCKDQCQSREEDFTYCSKANPGDLGTWHLKDYCTNNSTTEVTHEGIPCNDDCLRRGFIYFWCHTDDGYGYCTPKILIQKASVFAVTSNSSTSSTSQRLVNEDVDYEYENENTRDSNELQPEALAFTVYGEPCLDQCSNYENTTYTWCHKIEANDTGTWFDRGYCTNRANVTQFGENCLDECSKRDQAYYWCHKELALWGFCTPQFLLDKIR